MSIKIKVLLNALITIICVIGVGATGLIYTNRVADVSLALFDTQALPILKINEVDKTAQAVFSRLILHTTTSEGEVMEQVEGEIADLNAQLQKQIGEYQQIASAGDNQADADSANAWVAQFNGKWEEFNAFSAEILEMSQNFIKEDALAMMVGEEKKSYVEAMALLQARIGNHRTMMTAFRDEAVASSENSQTMIATFIGAALLIALLVAFLLGRSIVSPIMLGVDVARRISKGDLSKSIDIRRNDEIGVLANALREMQENIQGVLQTFNGVVKDIEMGKIRNRGDAGKYQGAFAELLEGGNKVADVLVHYIDLSPGIVLAMDTEYNVMFMNKKGLDLLDAKMDDVVGKKCHDLMKSSDCKNGNCACAKAMKTLAQERSETDSHPGGHDLDIEYVGVPITDSTGKAVGVFEFVVDQTMAKQAQKKMEDLADQASHISEQLASSTEELTAQVDQSSQGAELQRERAAETATAMEEMNSTVIEVAKNATEAASNADQAKQKATDGAEIVNQVIASINQVHDLAQELNANMENLGKQAEGIGQIMNVISDIADQTNLLALNAAIEAARAGDAGRGFAVVADEVRKLAEKTMSATTEVGTAIGSIQEVTRKNIKATEMAVEAVSTSTELSNKSGQELNQIVEMAEGTSDQVRAIATASEEQSATAEQISRSVEEINKISSETSEAMNQSAKAITELSHLAQSLDRLIQEMQS